MIVGSPQAFLAALADGGFTADSPACAQRVLMVEPREFRVDPESAVDNPYLDLENAADPERALAQSRALADAVRACGIEVVTFPGDPEATDGVFPNNVFATIPGRLIVGHMLHPGRQREARRQDIREYFATLGYPAVDLSERSCVAELTGPMVLDRARRIGFCGMSDRVDAAGVAAMHEAFRLRLTFCFDLVACEYHTNVVLAILAGRGCVLCPASFADPDVPQAIAAAYPGRTLLLTEAEKNAFAGNCIALGDGLVFMSQSGVSALRKSSRSTLESWGFEIISVELDEIEKAGGSLRCMLAEVF
jgi:hypothetical protein